MTSFACRPPRPAKKTWFFVFVFTSILANGCASTSARRADEIRSTIQNNLFSTEHLAFGADPRSVNAVRTATTEADIPTLVTLLSDSNLAVVRIAQYVLISYEEKAMPHLAIAANGSSPPSIVHETMEMIRNRKTQ